MAGNLYTAFKKGLALLLAGVMLMLSSCTKDKPGEYIIGNWQMQDSQLLVWVSFRDNGSFSLSQKLVDGLYRHYEGSYLLSGSFLSGEYSDGTPWANTYRVSFQDSGKIMTLSTANESYTYLRRDAIPGLD